MSDVAGEQVPGATQIGTRTSQLQRDPAPNEDLRIWVKAPVDFPYHKWLAFCSAVQAAVVDKMTKHGLVSHVDNGD